MPESLDVRMARLEGKQKALSDRIDIQFEAKETALRLAAATESQRRMFSAGIIMLVLSFISGIIGGAIVRWLVP
jgi:hypothetical protein